MASNNIKFIRGKKSDYNSSTHANAIFFTTDTQEILVNGVSYGNCNYEYEKKKSNFFNVQSLDCLSYYNRISKNAVSIISNQDKIQENKLQGTTTMKYWSSNTICPIIDSKYNSTVVKRTCGYLEK